MSFPDATLCEALNFLRGSALDVRNDLLNDGAVVWIGSGISRERVPSLEKLIERLITELSARQNTGDPDCPYRRALTEVVNLTTIRPDLTTPPASWDPNDFRQVTLQLINSYAQAFNVPLRIGGSEQDLAWTFMRLQDVYSDTALLPDAEHQFLAVLVAEGAVREMITTNWDPLVERAYKSLNIDPGLVVVASNAELNRQHGPLLFKIHGCAEKMRNDETRYRQHMIVTQNDLLKWTSQELFSPFREAVRALLREKPAVFVGISGQDFNLQAQCVVVPTNISYPIKPARVVFTCTIGGPQRTILRGIYADVYENRGQEIDENATLNLYAKPLLGAVFVEVILQKLKTIILAGASRYPLVELTQFGERTLVELERLLVLWIDTIASTQERWRTLALELPKAISRFLCIYRNDKMPVTTHAYHRIHGSPPTAMTGDPNLPATNLHWLTLAGLFMLQGNCSGFWKLHMSSLGTGEDGQVTAELSDGTLINIFLLERADAGTYRLEQNGLIQAGSRRRVATIYPSGSEPKRLRRSPARVLPGGSSSSKTCEIWLEDLANQAKTIDEISESLRLSLIAAAPV